MGSTHSLLSNSHSDQRDSAMVTINRRLALLCVGIVAITTSVAVSGRPGNGGGKPPKDPGPANPVIAFNTSQVTAGFVQLGGEIKVMDADGSSQTLVLDGEGRLVYNPAWSPDGRFLAFYGGIGGIVGCPDGPAIGLIELINRSTNEWGAPMRLVCLSTAAWASFSPILDGNRYTLAYFDELQPSASTELVVVTFDAPDGGPLEVLELVNTSNSVDISEQSTSWSPSGNEIAVKIYDKRVDPEDPTTWVQDLVIRDANGVGDPISLVQENLVAFGSNIVDRVGSPDWAKTSEEMILFAMNFDGGDYDIWCVEKTTGWAVNVTQHFDEAADLERNDRSPSWLPDDSGFLFARDQDKQIIEMKFGDNYDPANGCPGTSNLGSASSVVLTQAKGKRRVGVADYLRNVP